MLAPLVARNNVISYPDLPWLRVRTGYQIKYKEQEIIGTLRSNDGDGNENVIKAIGLIRKTTTLHVRHTFFVHFFDVFARLRRENA